MPVGVHDKKNYYSISKDGKIRYKSGNQEHLYDYIEGNLTKIDLVKDEYEGEVNFRYHFYLTDSNVTDILQVGEQSSAARGILLSLVSIAGPIQKIKIAPYAKTKDGKTYTNVWFEHNGQTSDWDKAILEQIPPVEEVKLQSGKTFLDDSARVAFFRKLAKRAKSKIYDAPTEIVDQHTGEITNTLDAPHPYGTISHPAPQPVKGFDLPENMDQIDDDLPF
jgi:hypothetical protein